MKKQKIALLGITLFTCLMVSIQAFADYCNDYCNDCCYDNCCNNCFGFNSVLTFDVGGGYRNDCLKWKRSLKESNQLIQERWNSIGMGIIEANANFLACEHYLLKVDFDYGWFHGGGHQTYKVFQNDDLGVSLKSNTSGNVYDLSGGVGYQFNFSCYRLTFAPLIGYSYDYQKYKNRKYENVFVEDDVRTIYKNRYIYRWRGPWIGVAFAYQPCCDILLFFDYAFHWSRLKATVNENFPIGRSTFKVNQAYGNEFTVGADYLFCDDWLIGLKFNYKNFWGNKSKFHTKQEDVELSHLKKLTWISYNITIDIGYKF